MHWRHHQLTSISRSAPRSVLHHYFDVCPSILQSLSNLTSLQETLSRAGSEFGGDDSKSAYSAFDVHTLGDISPDAL